MELSSSDKQVIDLLSKLKNTGGTYPAAIMASRRAAYTKQIANIGLGIGVGTQIKNPAKSGNSAGAVTTVTSKILETALITAIVIEASAAAYLYRDKIASLIRASNTGSASVQEVSTPSEEPVSPSDISINPTESPSDLVAVPTGTATSTPSSTVTIPPNTVTIIAATPSPESASNHNSGANVNSGVTPKPGGNNGNHYGQTPKPERTKDNNKDNKNNDNTEHKDKKDKDK